MPRAYVAETGGALTSKILLSSFVSHEAVRPGPEAHRGQSAGCGAYDDGSHGGKLHEASGAVCGS